MKSMLLHANSTAQWYALLNEAQQTSQTILKEDVESYLVFLLMRFMGEPTMAASVLGLEFLKSQQHGPYSQRHARLKEVGDKCLLFAGLFPGRAIRRRVKLSYYIKLGQIAYSTASTYITAQEVLYIRLCQEFPKLIDVLQATRNSATTLDLLQCLEYWHETGNKFAWQRLCEATNALPHSTAPSRKKH